MGTWQPPPSWLSSARSQMVATRVSGWSRTARCSLTRPSQARIHVAPQGEDLEVGAQGFELRLAPQAAGAHARQRRQVVEGIEVAREKSVARVLPPGDGGDLELHRQLRGQVLQAVHR